MQNEKADSAIAGEIMTPYIIKLTLDADFRQIIDKLYYNNITAVFIYDEIGDNHFIISQKDIVIFLKKKGLQIKHLADVPVFEIMRGPVRMLDFNTPVDKIIRFMNKHNYKRVLISKEGIATGVVSTKDIMKWNNTYFKPAKPQILFFMDNLTNIIVAKHIFEENIEDEIGRDVMDLYGGAINSLSIITNEVIKKSGKFTHLLKDKRSILFEPRRKITGILVCDYNSIDLRKKLQIATENFCDRYISQIESAIDKNQGIYCPLSIDEIFSIFKE